MMRDAGEFWDRVHGGGAWNGWLAQLLGACRRALGRATGPALNAR